MQPSGSSILPVSICPKVNRKVNRKATFLVDPSPGRGRSGGEANELVN